MVGFARLQSAEAVLEHAARSPSSRSREEKAGITNKGGKKTIWFQEDEAEALRLQAFKERRSESAIVQEAVRKLLRIED